LSVVQDVLCEAVFSDGPKNCLLTLLL